MTNNSTIIKAIKLTKWYGRVIALNKITVNIPAGITGLLGPNGAGKTTFIKLMIGNLRPSSGIIEVFNENPWQNKKLYKKIGYCPEYDAFYNWQTGREFVRTLTRLYGYTYQESVQLANEAIKTVKMEKHADRVIGGYSKGMKQRIKLAQAIAHDPELIILDEPLAGADPKTRAHLINIIRDYVKRGKSVIVSSHILHEIEKMSSRILLVYEGKLLAFGKIHEIRDLIDKHPHEIKIITENSRKLSKALVEHPTIISINFNKEDNNVLFVKTLDPATFYRDLPKIIDSLGLKTWHISSTDDNLEAVFKYLVKRE